MFMMETISLLLELDSPQERSWGLVLHLARHRQVQVAPVARSTRDMPKVDLYMIL